MTRRHRAQGRGRLRLAAALLASLASLASLAAAATHTLLPGGPWPAVAPGDTVIVAAGRHLGPWTIDVPDVTLRAQPGAVLDGGGAGTALTILASGVRVEGLTVTGVGPEADLYAPDAAVALFGAHGAAVAGLRADGVTAGVRVEDATGVHLTDLDLRGDGRGPGVTAYLAPGLRVERGRVEGFLDGVYVERSDGAHLADLELLGSRRYGLHVMFTVGARLTGNRVAHGGVGSAVMYGRGSILEDNLLEGHLGPMAFGLLVQEERDAVLRRNVLRGNTIGALVVAAAGATLAGNEFHGNGIGVLLDRAPPGSAADASSVTLTGQTFVANVADLAVADPDAALTLRANAFDRVAPLDLDRDGTVDLPFVATSAFAARAARQPDLLLLAYGPGIALWQRLEASVPGLRGSAFADPAPRRAAAWPRGERAGLSAALLAAGLAVAAVASAAGGRRWA